MTCAFCTETTVPGAVTVTLERGSTTLVFRRVPADVCPQCGEQWVDSDVTGHLLELLEKHARDGAEVIVSDYARAA